MTQKDDQCFVTLFSDDFRSFPIGEFPYDRDHSAAGEYHYTVEKGRHGAWRDPVCNYRYNGHGPSWIITEQDGKHFMEQCRIEKGLPHRMFPTLEAGSAHWNDYTFSVKLRRISTKGMAGIAFAMNDSIDTLVFSAEWQRGVQLAYRHKEEVRVLAEAPCPEAADCDGLHEMKVQLSSGRVTCLFDGRVLMTWSGPEARRGGRIGLTADCPTMFTDVLVTGDREAVQKILTAQETERKHLAALQAGYPAMKLWKRINLKNFGTSRQIRFGHLTGTNAWYIVLAQAQKRVDRDAYATISCLTAIDLDGNILWQRGEPTDQEEVLGKVSCDLPLQVYDIDGDGADEVITAKNFRILILDGKTGRIKKSAPTPFSTEADNTIIGPPYGIYAFDRINPDGIRICNFRGLLQPRDILIKDRYCRIYALDDDLNVMWMYQSPKNTGHFPCSLDINGDGHDELLVGYTLLDCHGQPLWTYPFTEDHTDEIVYGKFRKGSDKGYFACVSGTQGFFIGDFHGSILTRDKIGHAQRVSVGNYCPDREGFTIAVTNFWGHQGVLYLYDDSGQEIWEKENGCNGNILAPVNWLGNGTDFILTNADPDKGGLMDGNGDIAVAFPDDGHPTLCCEAIDLTGDDRDELVVWDFHSLYIYTQSDGLKQTTYHPVKYPWYNASNYRGEFSYPDVSFVTFHENLP
jgi:rhamnogalacturonan endolyase